MRSLGLLLVTDGSDRGVLFGHIVVDFPVLEARLAGLDAVGLAHFEVFAEVLVAAPPVQVDHTQTLVSALLVSVRVFQVVLLSIDGEAAVLMRGAMLVISLANHVAPVLAHALLTVLKECPQDKRGVQVEGASEPHEAHAVLLVQRRRLPVHIANWVFKEASDVLETSPLLTHVLRLLHVRNKLGKVAISVLRESSISIN